MDNVPESPVVLEAVDVTRHFGVSHETGSDRSGYRGTEVLHGVSLSLRRGEFVALTGPSGSGKSTLLHLLGGMDTPTSGRILVEGVDTATLDDAARTRLRQRRLGFVFQAFNLLPSFTAEENVAIGPAIGGVAFPEASRRAVTLLEWVGLTERRRSFPSEMSGGEQQRVAIARALVMDPAILLADEPTGNLDTANGLAIIELFRRLADERGQTILFATHAPELAQMADRIIRMRDGRIETPDVQND
ncbi:MAG: ABC transporter ATP-binding protein [Planctomycetia bacterium]|nr:ABC transporter ATP-binding protein [Planctomycetia bacterium]